MYKDFDAIKNKIVAICERKPAIEAAYVFGSCAKGKQTQSSDLDVAILLNETKTADFSMLTFITVLEKQLDCKVDVVGLNNAGEVLKYEVRRKGIRIFDRSSQYRKRFEIRGRKSYEDFLHLHKKYVKAVLYGGANGRQDPS